MAKHEPRIWEKLDEWTAAGLISSAQAAAIRASEPAPKSTPPWGIMIFACSGAVVLGMGVILLFAYNWDQMHKFGKLAIIFTALAAAHTTGIILRSKNLTPGFADAAFLLGSMIFGAGIWLVAQIYISQLIIRTPSWYGQSEPCCSPGCCPQWHKGCWQR